MNGFKILSVQDGGVAIMGFYEVKGQVYFTCINQDGGTPPSDWMLNYNLHWSEAGKHMREQTKHGTKVFVPIAKPK